MNNIYHMKVQLLDMMKLCLKVLESDESITIILRLNLVTCCVVLIFICRTRLPNYKNKYLHRTLSMGMIDNYGKVC